MAYFGTKRCILILGALLLINLALFSIPGVPGSTARITASAPDQTPPDILGIYSPEVVTTFLETIGAEGRAQYQIMHLTTDLAFPLVYGLSLFSLLSWLTLRLNLQAQWIPWLGLLATGFDLAENFTFVFITDRYPQEFSGLTWLAQVFTIGKFAMVGISILAALYLGLRKLSQTLTHS